MTVPTIPVVPVVPIRSTAPSPAAYREDVEDYHSSLNPTSVGYNTSITVLNGELTTFNTKYPQTIAAATSVQAMYEAFAAGSIGGLAGSSTSSVLIGTGTKNFTTQTGKFYATGQILEIRSIASPANYMIGSVTSYDATNGALVMSVFQVGGAGTLASWEIFPSSIKRPYTLIGTLNTTSGTVWTLNPLPDTYTDLYIEIAGFSHSGASTTALRVEFYDGTTWSVGTNLTASTVAAADTVTAAITVTAYNMLSALLASAIATGTLSTINTSAGIKGIRFTTPAGYTGDAGAIRIWGN